jgi:hypothetical protein
MVINMTSSLSLTKRKQMGDVWNIKNFSHPELPLGGWEDHYIVNGGHRECHPNFYAIPIGNPYGFMMCVRRRDEEGRALDTAPGIPDFSHMNGLHRNSADLYDPSKAEQTQMFNPYPYDNRNVSNFRELIRDDYYRLPIKYNGTGIKPVRNHGHGKEFGFSHLENDPPLKFNITRLIQPYPIWKEEQEYLHSLGKTSNPLDHTKHDEFDQQYTSANPDF